MEAFVAISQYPGGLSVGELIHSITVYASYFRRFLLARLSYQTDFLAGIFANVIMTASGLVYVIFLINGDTVPSLQGWTREEVLFIYGYSMVAMAIFMSCAMNLYQFSDRYIIQGSFDRVLLRPVNSLFQVLFESFNLESVGSLATGLGVLVYCAHHLEIHFGPLDILWLVVSSISGGVILIGVFVIVASTGFHFEDKIGISAPVFNLTNFGRYPLPIFGRPIRVLLSWIVPFAFVAFFPATHFLRHEGFEMFCYATPLMAAAVTGVAALAWQFGVSRYQSTGN